MGLVDCTGSRSQLGLIITFVASSRGDASVSPVSPASTVHIKPRVVGDATKEHPYRLARVSRGVEFYRGAAAMEESGLSSLGEAVCDHQVGEKWSFGAV